MTDGRRFPSPLPAVAKPVSFLENESAAAALEARAREPLFGEIGLLEGCLD